MLRPRACFLVFSLAISLALVVGCGDDDDPVTPDADVGTVVVNPTPDTITAPWTLAGPADYSHADTGDQTLNGLAVGEYTLTWQEVSGYIAPAEETKTLASDQTITFDGVYVEDADVGTIVVDQTPNSLAGSGWTLTGPQGESGSGDATLQDMPVGEYTLTWDAVAGYTTPSAGTQTLSADSTITFSGTYEEIEPAEGFVSIPSGQFVMGSPTSEPLRGSNETQHTVTLTGSFWMQSTEVTNAQYAELAQWALDNGHCTATSSSLRDALDGSSAELLDLDDSDCEISYSGGVFTVDAGQENHPVLEVTWYGAAAYCDWLSLREGLPRAYDHDTWQCNGHDPYGAEGYRLPTEAEWEYACRAGTTTPFNTGSCLDAGTEANYRGTSPYVDCPDGPYEGETVPVGSYPRNDWDLHDMHGNVYEWCNDWYDSYGGDATDPAGPSGPVVSRVIRGGSWAAVAQNCRSANRNYSDPDYSVGSFGFRPVRSTP